MTDFLLQPIVLTLSGFLLGDKQLPARRVVSLVLHFNASTYSIIVFVILVYLFVIHQTFLCYKSKYIVLIYQVLKSWDTYTWRGQRLTFFTLGRSLLIVHCSLVKSNILEP